MAFGSSMICSGWLTSIMSFTEGGGAPAGICRLHSVKGSVHTTLHWSSSLRYDTQCKRHSYQHPLHKPCHAAENLIMRP